MILKTKEEFLNTYKITEEQFEAADISWEDLNSIHDSYLKKMPEYKRIGGALHRLLYQKSGEMGFHFVYWRIKDPEHLIAKIIRRRNSNYKKYKFLNKENYWQIVTDLIGFRGIIVFKEDWPDIHQKILKKFHDRPELYMDRNEYAKNDEIPNGHLVEAPIAHIRAGDSRELYLKYLKAENIMSKENYRAVHYVFKYKDIYVELQVRTLFEEALGEMDHRIRYPEEADNKQMNRYASVLNQLVGAADELGSIYLTVSHDDVAELPPLSVSPLKGTSIKKGTSKSKRVIYTPGDCLHNMVKE